MKDFNYLKRLLLYFSYSGPIYWFVQIHLNMFSFFLKKKKKFKSDFCISETIIYWWKLYFDSVPFPNLHSSVLNKYYLL